MERDAHYAAVGIATVALLAALAVFTIWLARLQFNSDYDMYDIVFYGPVNGLSEGGEVHFNGIRVGEVQDVRLLPQDPRRVIAAVQVEPTTPLRADTRARQRADQRHERLCGRDRRIAAGVRHGAGPRT